MDPTASDAEQRVEALGIEVWSAGICSKSWALCGVFWHVECRGQHRDQMRKSILQVRGRVTSFSNSVPKPILQNSKVPKP